MARAIDAASSGIGKFYFILRLVQEDWSLEI